MLPAHLALVSLTSVVDFGALSRVSAAIQKQIIRDFTPIWSVDATIDAFARTEDVPLGYWKILVVDTFANRGQHRDRQNQPYALVAAGRSWSLVASHEALEMLADPFGNRLIAGESSIADQGRVEFLVEVCDPCQSDVFAYSVNNQLVSDFYTPKYFDPVQADGVRYRFTGAVTAPRQVLAGGYLTWRDAMTRHWFQARETSGSIDIKELGEIAPGANSLRPTIDALSPDTAHLADLPADRPSMITLRRRQELAYRAAAAEAAAIRRQLRRRRLGAQPPDASK